MKEKTQNISGRVDFVDVAKGYGMLCVIAAHLGIGILGTWMYSFHLPLFFFLSGFVFRVKTDFAGFLKRKCKTMLLPYFALGTVMVLFSCFVNLLQGEFSFSLAGGLFLRLLVQRRFWTLWFIACLFFLELIFYWIVKKLVTPAKIALAAGALTLSGLVYYHYIGIALPWNADACLTASGFFGGGYIFRTQYHKLSFLFKKTYSVFWFFLFWIINLAAWYLTLRLSGEGLEMFASRYGVPPLTYLAAFAGILSVVIFSHWFTPKPILYIGKNSILYYAWHQTILIPAVTYLFAKVGFVYEALQTAYGRLGYRAAELCGILLLLTVCNLIISNTKLKFMLGK